MENKRPENYQPMFGGSAGSTKSNPPKRAADVSKRPVNNDGSASKSVYNKTGATARTAQSRPQRNETLKSSDAHRFSSHQNAIRPGVPNRPGNPPKKRKPPKNTQSNKSVKKENPVQEGGFRKTKSGYYVPNRKSARFDLKKEWNSFAAAFKSKLTVKNIIIAVAVVVLIIALNVAITIINPGKPHAKLSSASAGLKISWDKVSDAKEYEIYKQTDGQWLIIQRTNKTSYTDKKVKNDIEYKYRIRSVDGNKHSAYRVLTSKYYSPVKAKEIAVEKGSITIGWTAVNTATGYEIYKKTGNDGKNIRIATVNADVNKYQDTDVKDDTDYTYSVVQKVGAKEGAMPKKGLVLSINTKLRNPQVKNSPAGVTVSWNAEVPGVSGYAIERKIKGGSWTEAGRTDASAVSFIDLENPSFGKYTTYRVAPVFGDSAGNFTETNSIYTVNPAKKLVALTYDDGPYTKVTNSLLDTMEKYGVRCTFFWVGERVASYESSVKRAGELDCEIASHTYSHVYLSKIDKKEIPEELSKAKEVLEKASGKEVTLLRPPGGYSVTGIEYPQILWSVDTMDWSNRDKAQTLARAKSAMHDGAIVLMHDLYPSSAEATKELVPWLIENGYQIVTVSELFEARGIRLQPGVKYVSAAIKD